jgi:hypothetical protein
MISNIGGVTQWLLRSSAFEGCLTPKVRYHPAEQMIAPDDCYEHDWEGYEPDSEDLACELAKEMEFEQWASYVHESEHQFRASTGTDKQLRNISKESKSLARELSEQYRFDVASDCFEVDLDGKTSITVSRNGVPRNEVLHTLTRKDKRRMKKESRQAARQLGILTKRGCSPRELTGYEDMSFATVVAAA